MYLPKYIVRKFLSSVSWIKVRPRPREASKDTHCTPAHQLFSIGEGSLFVYTAEPKYVCVIRLAGAGHLSPPVLWALLSVVPRWTIVYIDTCHGCVFSLAAVCWLALRSNLTAVPWLLLKPGHTPYPLPCLGSMSACLPDMANGIAGHAVHGPVSGDIPLLSFAAVCWLPMDLSCGSQQHTI